MEANVKTFAESWQRAVEAGDYDATLELLSDEMTFYSPAIHTPMTERPYIDKLLGFVAESIDGFHYTDFYEQKGGVAMLFSGTVGDLTVEGVDFFKVNDDGKASELKVMIRPLNAAMMLAQSIKGKFDASMAQEA